MVFLVVFFSCSKNGGSKNVAAQNDDAQKWNDLLYEAYEANDYDKAYEYAKKSAALGDATGEYWMGWWTMKGDQNTEECVDWFKKSAMHGSVAAQQKLGELYETRDGFIVHDYAEARRWYEMAVANGCDDEDVTDALARLPAADDYPALFELALLDELRGPNFPLAFMYAVKGGFADAGFDNSAMDPMGCFFPAGSGQSASRVLADCAYEQIEAWKGNGLKIADEYVSFYRAAHDAGNASENLSYLLSLLDKK